MLFQGGENRLKYLKRGWNRKERRGNKDFRNGASWVKEFLKKGGGAGIPLPTMSIIKGKT